MSFLFLISGSAASAAVISNGSFEAAPVGSFAFNVPPAGWTQTATATGRTVHTNAIGYTLGVPANLDGDQYLILETGGVGETVALSQAISGGISAGEALSLSALITPWDGGGPVDFGQATITYGFFADAALTSALGTTVTVNLSTVNGGSAAVDEVLLNYGLASYTATGAEGAIYAGAIQYQQANTTPSNRSRSAIDLIAVNSAVVPVPATAWLLGSALGLLGWMRRR